MKILAQNKKGNFNYEILETFEAGIALKGPEVKSVKSGHINISESFATVKNNEILLTNAHIAPYKPAGIHNPTPTRTRQLLLKRLEIDQLTGKLKSGKFLLVPLKIYEKNGLIKAELGLARSKKKHDKREQIKKREQEREIKRAIKER